MTINTSSLPDYIKTMLRSGGISWTGNAHAPYTVTYSFTLPTTNSLDVNGQGAPGKEALSQL